MSHSATALTSFQLANQLPASLGVWGGPAIKGARHPLLGPSTSACPPRAKLWFLAAFPGEASIHFALFFLRT